MTRKTNAYKIEKVRDVMIFPISNKHCEKVFLRRFFIKNVLYFCFDFAKLQKIHPIFHNFATFSPKKILLGYEQPHFHHKHIL